MKRAGVIHCLDFDNLLSRSQERNPHFSRNLPRDRKYIRQALKAKKIQAEKVLSSEEEQEAEVLDKDERRSHTSQQMSARPARPLLVPRRFKTEQLDSIPLDAPPQPTARHLPVVKMEPIVIDLTISDSDGDTKPVTRTHKRSRSYLSPSMPSSSASSDSSHSSGADSSDDDVRAWPSSFYVVDVVHGFEKCEVAARGRKSVREAFIKCFQVPFRHTTFYTHRRHWEGASQACRDDALRAGRTPAGTWTTFLERSRGRKPAMGNLKKKNKKRVKV